MKTTSQIEAEIATLKFMKPTVRQFSVFGDDHHQAIDAQIETLSQYLDAEDVHDAFGEDAMGDEFSQNELDAALAASDWMFELAADDKPPSADWQSLVK